MEVLELMRKYNTAIDSYKRAELYFAREDILIEEKQARAADCMRLVNHLDGLMTKIQAQGYQMTDDEVLMGFKQLKFIEEGGCEIHVRKS